MPRNRVRSAFGYVTGVLVGFIVIFIIGRQSEIRVIQWQMEMYGPGQTIPLPNPAYVINSGLFYDSVCLAQVTGRYFCFMTMMPYETIIGIIVLLLIVSIVLWRKA